MQGDDGACRPRWATRLAKVCSLFIISVCGFKAAL
jgi:hypothetical protein